MADFNDLIKRHKQEHNLRLRDNLGQDNPMCTAIFPIWSDIKHIEETIQREKLPEISPHDPISQQQHRKRTIDFQNAHRQTPTTPKYSTNRSTNKTPEPKAKIPHLVASRSYGRAPERQSGTPLERAAVGGRAGVGRRRRRVGRVECVGRGRGALDWLGRSQR